MSEHLDRTVAAMAEQDVDVLLLGRTANVRWVSDADALWLAGTRPWGPACVVVRDPAAVHLVATSDAGMPASIPHDRVFAVTWNPAKLVAWLAQLAAGARRVGVDGMTPTMDQMLRDVLPTPWVDADALLRGLRRTPSAEDLDAVRAAASVCRVAFAAMVDGLPDAPGRELQPSHLAGRFLGAMCLQGVTTPAFDPVVRALGGAVTLEAGVLRRGWEASIGRSIAPGAGDAPDRWTERRDEVAASIVPGRPLAELRRLGVHVDGLGMGLEHLPDDDVLTAGSVVELRLVHEGVFGRDTVVVGADVGEVLTA
jgi:Xaa-Pro dipeptidase